MQDIVQSQINKYVIAKKKAVHLNQIMKFMLKI